MAAASHAIQHKDSKIHEASLHMRALQRTRHNHAAEATPSNECMATGQTSAISPGSPAFENSH